MSRAAREADRLEAILALLRSRGGRLTTARRAIVTALCQARGHITADGLAHAIQQAHPDVHLTTIYRCLDALEELGVVDHVHLGHGRAVYHLTDEAHQHLVCEQCGAVLEVPDATFDDLAGRLQADYGFAIRPHHFAVLGRCRRCQERAGTDAAVNGGKTPGS
jgi:Fur family transcriptional regulator, ferric uptake regulator